MACLHLALLLTYVFGAQAAESSSLWQQPAFLWAGEAGEVSLQCLSKAETPTWVFWYKQTPRRKPVIVTGVYKKEDPIFYNQFKNDSRFSLGTENGNYCLNISDLRASDSGTYYCATSNFNSFDFAQGTVVSVEGSSTNVLASPASESSQPLECRVEDGSRDGEHWFRDAGGSHAGTVNTMEQTHTCGYKLRMKSWNTSRTGIYCAVASCGHLLLEERSEEDSESEGPHPVLVLLLSGTLVFTVILTVLLSVLLCKRCDPQGSPGRSPPAAHGERCGEEPGLQYEPLHCEVPNRSRVEQPQSECVYTLAQLPT